MFNWFSSACILWAEDAGSLYVNTTISMVLTLTEDLDCDGVLGLGVDPIRGLSKAGDLDPAKAWSCQLIRAQDQAPGALPALERRQGPVGVSRALEDRSLLGQVGEDVILEMPA